MPFGIGRGSGIAVVELHGVIGNQIRAAAYARLFETVANSKYYRALLLDIDSPGGSAAASEVLHRSIERVAENKPVVAYVRGMGASGGYYLCCAASQVFAMPTSLVGSIGVIYMRPVIEQLLGRAGVEFTIFKGGKYKDMTGFWRSPTSEEAERLQGLINEIYDNFVQVVVKGRSMSEEAVRELATGEIVTGQRALETGLIDHIGDFTDALNAAAEEGKTRPRPKFLQPRRSLSQKLMGRSSAKHSSIAGLAGGMQRLFSGGIYYLDPAFMAGWPGEVS
jgi:protease-4